MSLIAFTLLTRLLLSDPRALHLLYAAAALGLFLSVRAPARILLVLVPFAAIANLEGWIARSGPAYPSEALLLAATGAVAMRQPAVFRFRGSARIALSYGAWIAVASLVATPIDADAVGGPDAVHLVRSGFLAASLAALAGSLAADENVGALWSRAALGAAGLLGLLAIGESILDPHPGVPNVGRMVGGSELLALHLTLLAPPGFVLAFQTRPRFRGAAIALLALAGAGLVLSFSRSGWAGGLTAILCMGAITRRTDRIGSRRLFSATALLFLGGGIVLAALAVGFRDGELARVYADRVRSLVGLDLFADRAEAWRLGMRSILEHPWFGRPDAPNPYNLALDLAAKSGLPALGLFLWTVGSSLASGIRGLRGEAASPFVIGLIGAVVAMLVCGVGESTLGVRMTPGVFATLGVLAGLGARRLSGQAGDAGVEQPP